MLKSSSKCTLQQFGATAERAVALYLQQRGYTILAMNFSCKLGEIDIIAKQGTTICCVEVKARTVVHFPLSTVITPPKQRKLFKTAQYFFLRHNLQQVSLRFDVALVYGTGAEQSIDYIEHAFEGRLYE